MKFQFLGRAEEVGHSAILADDSLPFNYGMLTGNPPQLSVGSVEPNVVAVSHGYSDHIGAVPSFPSDDD